MILKLLGALSSAALFLLWLHGHSVYIKALCSDGFNTWSKGWSYKISKTSISLVFLVHYLSSLLKHLHIINHYLFDTCSIFGTCLYIEHCSKFFQTFFYLLLVNPPFVFKISFGTNKEKNNFLMSMLSYLFIPHIDALKSFLIIDCKCQKNSCNAFVECTNNSLKSLLTSL